MAVAWTVESIRLSLFFNQAVQVNEADWQELTRQAEAETRQAIPGGRVFAGPYEGNQLHLSAAGSRADLVLSALLQNSPSNGAAIPTIGRWEEVRDGFIQLTGRWNLLNQSHVVRLAFGTVLLWPSDSNENSYEILQSNLRSVNVQPNRMRDLVYRVNWPGQSSCVQNLSINRITNWNALTATMQQLQIGGLSTSAIAAEQKYFVRLEIDHNTDAARQEPFAPSDLKRIYEELLRLASENVSSGEVI